jgi:signal transduction histidine kinase
MMKSIQWLFAIALTLGFTAPALCDERATKEEAKTMVDAAYDHIKKVGAEQAFKDFNTDKAKWTKKDLYVMAYDAQAVCLANGANQGLVGKNMKDLKDANGVPIIVSLLDKAAKGGGWVEYEWTHPQTHKAEAKTTFARQLPDGSGFVGVGVYR